MKGGTLKILKEIVSVDSLIRMVEQTRKFSRMTVTLALSWIRNGVEGKVNYIAVFVSPLNILCQSTNTAI